MHPDLTEETFIKKAGAKKGYALKMFSDMYQSITSEKIDVVQEFEKYYSSEYKSFPNFLFKKYNMKVKLIKQIMDAMEENPKCKLYRKEQNSHGDWGISTFMLSDTLEERITKILLLK